VWGVELPANAESFNYVYLTNKLCATDTFLGVNYDPNTKSLVIDLDAQQLKDLEVTSLTIGNEPAVNCLLEVNSLEFLRSSASTVDELNIHAGAFLQSNNPALQRVKFPEGITTLNIGDYAFWQMAAANGGATVLREVEFPSSLESLNIGAGAFIQESSNADTSLQKIEFPANLTSLTIGVDAFWQRVQGNGNTALKEVVFPSGPNLKTLKIGEVPPPCTGMPPCFPGFQHSNAFRQDVFGDGNTTLQRVVFPPKLESLTVSAMAFWQNVQGVGSTALQEVVFPTGLTSLTVGMRAFYQHTAGGAGVTLESVTFPANLDYLQIDNQAFAQEVAAGKVPALKYFMFPTANKIANTLVLDPAMGPNDITQLSIDPYGADSKIATLPWLWLGQNSSTDTEWNTGLDADYPLVGLNQAAVRFDPNGGGVAGSDTPVTVTQQGLPVWSGYADLEFDTWSWGAVDLAPPTSTPAKDGALAWEFAGWSPAGYDLPPDGSLLQPGVDKHLLAGSMDSEPPVFTAHWRAVWHPELKDVPSVAQGESISFLDPVREYAKPGVEVVSRVVQEGLARVVGSDAEQRVVFEASADLEVNKEYVSQVLYTFSDGYTVIASQVAKVLPITPPVVPATPEGDDKDGDGVAGDTGGDGGDSSAGDTGGDSGETGASDSDSPGIVVKTGGALATASSSALLAYTVLLLASGALVLALKRSA
jgi:hypothetical protein